MRILILSLSRSGSTALYYHLLGAMPASCAGYFEPTPDSILGTTVPDSAVVKMILDAMQPGALPAVAARFDRRVVIVRDPRDRLVSSMLFAMHGVEKPVLLQRLRELERKRRHPKDVPFLQLVERVFPGWTPELIRQTTQTVHAQASAAQSLDGSSITLRYEDYIRRGAGELARYLSLDLSVARPLPERHAYGRRRVIPGDWKNWFTVEDVAFFKPLMQPFLERFQYRDDWELNRDPTIPAEHSTEFVMSAYEKDRALRKSGINWRQDSV